MLKNVASQVVAAQMISASNGSNVTAGTTAVYVTGDGGTQATTGNATHEGNGCWTYVPSQAQTNYSHIAFTFVNTSAVSVTVNVYTVPVAIDSLATAAALATLATAVGVIDDYVDSEVAAIKAKTDNLPSDPADASDLAALLATITAYIDTEVAAIKAKTDNLPSDPADESLLEAAIADLKTYVDTEIAAIKAKTDQLTFTTPNHVDATATVSTPDKTGYSLAADGLDAIEIPTPTDTDLLDVTKLVEAIAFVVYQKISPQLTRDFAKFRNTSGEVLWQQPRTQLSGEQSLGPPELP